MTPTDPNERARELLWRAEKAGFVTVGIDDMRIIVSALSHAAAVEPTDFLTIGTKAEWQDNLGRWWPVTITGWSPAVYRSVLEDGTEASGYARGRFRCTAPPPAPAAVAGGEAEEDAYVIDALAHLLAEISIIVNGPEPAGTKWSYHDLPEKVAELKRRSS